MEQKQTKGIEQIKHRLLMARLSALSDYFLTQSRPTQNEGDKTPSSVVISKGVQQ